MGTREKDVVLKIARKLRDNLNKREGYQAFLTRTGDYYVPFKKRLKIARDYGADVFVSVHADAVRNRTIRGGSAYILSTGGATNEAARLLARKENLARAVQMLPAIVSTTQMRDPRHRLTVETWNEQPVTATPAARASRTA